MSTSESIANEDAKDLKVELGRDSQMAADEKPTIGEVEDDEVFHSGPGQADFRALGWYCSIPFTRSFTGLLTSSRYLAGRMSADTPEICRMRTAIILMKLCFATGVLAIPSAFEEVGYGPGIILLFVWGAMCTCKPAAKPPPSNSIEMYYKG